MPQNPFYIEPASGLPGFQALQEGVQKRVDYERKKAEEAQKMKKRQEAGEIINRNDPEEVAQFMIENPDIAAEMRKTMEHKDELTEQNYKESLERIIIGDEPPSKVGVERSEFVINRGGDAAESMQFTAEAQAEQEATGNQEQAKKRAELYYAMHFPKEWEALSKARAGEIAEPEVGAREILEDGTIIQSTPKGPVVWSPTGERLKGQAAADQIKIARAEKVSNLRKASGEKKRASLEAEDELKGKVEAGVISAKEAAKISTQAFDRLEKINKNIANLEEGIRLLDEGAETGAVTGLLPSARASSIKLDNLQGRLGLDVLHSTTFGALSAAELRFALSTALPKRLDKVELKEWITEKKAAQEKLADYLESAAIYLGTPGNTVAGWMEKQREKRDTPQYTEGQTATGPNGEKVIFRNGQWEAM